MEKQKQKKYLTKKRKIKVLKMKVFATLFVVGLLSGMIWSEGLKVVEAIEGLADVGSITTSKKTELIVQEIIGSTIREVTAYNVGDVNQTDSTPCIGAYSKVNLCEEVGKGVNVCAGNFVPLGTRLLIEAENGWSFECVVWDRMASKHGERVDIAMNYWEHDRAVKFGLQNLVVKILGDKTILKQ